MSVTAQEEKKFVAFRLNQEYYAIDVFQVQEVFTPTSITPIPQAPDFTAGVINFRGTIVTVIDLKIRLQISGKSSSRKDRTKYEFEDEEDRLYVIIVKTEDSVVGLLVDYVESVIGVPTNKIQSALDLISSSNKTTFLTGVAETELGLTILLSLDTLLSEYDISNIEELARLREKLNIAGEGDEVVIDSDSMLDLDEDDISDYERSAPQFRQVSSGSGDADLGSSSLDLNILTKAELLKIAKEMEIDSITTKSSKNEIIDAINMKMNP